MFKEAIRRLARKLTGQKTVPKCSKCGRFLKKWDTMWPTPEYKEHKVINGCTWICRNPKCKANMQGRLIE